MKKYYSTDKEYYFDKMNSEEQRILASVIWKIPHSKGSQVKEIHFTDDNKIILYMDTWGESFSFDIDKSPDNMDEQSICGSIV